MPWQIELSNDVAIVTMNSNPVNCQNEKFFSDLHQAFDRLEREFSDAPVVITASGAVFSSGLDFEEVFLFFSTASADDVYAWFQRYRAINLRVLTYPRPVIAAINGHAYAGGLVTALACDYRLAAEGDARFGLNEVPVGIPMPSTYLEFIKYAIGSRSSALVSLFGQMYSGRQAMELGILHQICPKSELLEEAVTVARSFSRLSLEAYAVTKRALQFPVLQTIEEISPSLDRAASSMLVSPDCRRAQAVAYRRLKGEPPPWAVELPG